MERNALLTAFDKTRVVEFAKELNCRHWNLYASGGTAKLLRENGVPVIDIATMVGEPILGHKVVTLSREIMAGLLADRENESDAKEMKEKNLVFFDLVYVNLYPLLSTIESPGDPISVLAATDIGGPTILRAAAKGLRYILSEPKHLDPFIKWLENGEKKSEIMRNYMRVKAEAVVSDYVMESFKYWNKRLPDIFEALW